MKPIILNFISFIEEFISKWLICLKIIKESNSIFGISVSIDVGIDIDVSIDVVGTVFIINRYSSHDLRFEGIPIQIVSLFRI